MSSFQKSSIYAAAITYKLRIIRVNDISPDTESGKALLRLIRDEDFPLYEEYVLLRNWVDKRERMKNIAGSGTSLTEMLGIDMMPGN